MQRRPRLAEDDLAGGTEPGRLFRWLPLGDLATVRFEPAVLILVLPRPGDGLRHVVLS